MVGFKLPGGLLSIFHLLSILSLRTIYLTCVPAVGTTTAAEQGALQRSIKHYRFLKQRLVTAA